MYESVRICMVGRRIHLCFYLCILTSSVLIFVCMHTHMHILPGFGIPSVYTHSLLRNDPTSSIFPRKLERPQEVAHAIGM